VRRRWYKEPLFGTTEDTQKQPGRTLYVRDESVSGVLKGSFHVETESKFDAVPR